MEILEITAKELFAAAAGGPGNRALHLRRFVIERNRVIRELAGGDGWRECLLRGV